MAKYRDQLAARQGAPRNVPHHQDMEPGDPVYVQLRSGSDWKPATVEEKDGSPFSYKVKLPDNSIIRRTRSMLKPRPTPSQEEQRWTTRELDPSKHFQPPHFQVAVPDAVEPATPSVETSATVPDAKRPPDGTPIKPAQSQTPRRSGRVTRKPDFFQPT